MANHAKHQEQLNRIPFSVPFTDVNIIDDFWTHRQKQLVSVTIEAGIRNVECPAGGIPNFISAGKKNRGEAYEEQHGELYVDSDVHKLMESMCYALQIDPQGDQRVMDARKNISAKLEEWIGYYQAAQEPDGYFDTYFTLSHPDEKWTDFNKHELYCAGHFYELAVAHYRMTDGKDTRLFDMAIKNADLIESLFGVGKWKQVPGHQEIELALLKLARLCSEIRVKDGVDYAEKAERYVALSRFFLDTRGNLTGRHGYNPLPPHMNQDNLSILKQKEAISHAVRAQYMYTAVADMMILTGGTQYCDVLLTLWKSVASKSYVTGGVGTSDYHEGFGPDYYMPLDKAYCETCSSVARILWNQRMNLLFCDSKYADIMETVLYNALLDGIDLDGRKFFYTNTVVSPGRERVQWYGTACCPPNLMRLVCSLGGYIYNQREDCIQINLYIGNRARLSVADGEFIMDVRTAFPWDGNVTVRIHAEGPRHAALKFRVPGWAKGTNLLKVNGKEQPAVPGVDGYIDLKMIWRDGDSIELDFPMEVRSIPMDPRVTYTENRIAFCRGPLVYAAESVDNSEDVRLFAIPADAGFHMEWLDNLDGKEDPFGVRGLVRITTQDAVIPLRESNVKKKLVLIPYYAVANRGETPMTVYFNTVSKDERTVSAFQQ